MCGAERIEIEQLRADFNNLLRLAANDASEYQAEIERLRGLLKEMSLDTGPYMWKARSAFWHDEAEKLRSLLREWLDGTALLTLTGSREFAARVREALGDVPDA